MESDVVNDSKVVEEWRSLPRYEGRYEISSEGRVWSHLKHGLLSPGLGTRRYPGVLLTDREGRKTSFMVHRLVAEVFLGPCPEGQQVRHIDGNPKNPAAANLIYGTCRQNQLDSIGHGTHAEARKTQCINGHEFTPDNTYRLPSKPTNRICRTCNRATRARQYQRSKAHRP